MNPKFQDLAFDAVIPSALLFNENIEASAIKLYAFVRGLSRLEGYCYATNGYLSECMSCDESTVKRLLSSLKEEGFIEIETDKEGVHWQRKIYLGCSLKKSLRRLENEPPPVQKRAPPSAKISYNKRYPIRDIKKESEEKGALPPASPPLPTPPLEFKIHKRVKMALQKHKNLVEEFGQEKILEMMDRLDEYADINPKRFKAYGCHSMVIRKWIREDKQKQPNASKGHLKDLQYIQRLQEYLGKHPHKDILTGDDYVVFQGIHGSEHVAGGPEFQSKVTRLLIKMGINVK